MKKNNKEKIIKNHKLFYSEFCQDKNKQNKNEQDKKYKYWRWKTKDEGWKIKVNSLFCKLLLIFVFVGFTLFIFLYRSCDHDKWPTIKIISLTLMLLYLIVMVFFYQINFWVKRYAISENNKHLSIYSFYENKKFRHKNRWFKIWNSRSCQLSLLILPFLLIMITFVWNDNLKNSIWLIDQMENHDEINMFLLISNTLMSLITITSIIYGLGGKENNGVLNKMCKLYVIDCVFLMIAVTLSSLMSYLLDNEFSLLFSYLFSLLLIYEIFHYYFSLLIEYKEKKEEEEEKYKQKNK